MAETEKLTPRQRERRKRIVDAARALVAEHGHETLTMRAIAQRSGTAEKTLYNIFGTKDRLIAAMARDVSLSLFEAALESAPQGGWTMLHNFARLSGELTLADPPMSRALAAIVVDHGELVGLHDLYAVRIATAIDQMVEDGMIIAPPSRSAIVWQVRLGVVAAVLFWSRGEIGDAELGAYILAKIGETFLPFIDREKGAAIWRDVRVAHQNLAGFRGEDAGLPNL